MHNNFKTPALFNLLAFFENKYPQKINIIRTYYSKLCDLDLNCNNRYYAFETYQQVINLITGEDIYIIWNIDKIIEYGKNNNIIPKPTSTEEILASGCFMQESFESIFTKVLANQNFNFPHKVDYIIIAGLPYFDGYTIIDGNHRFCEALIAKKKSINCVVLNPQYANMFLLKDSQKFIEIFVELACLVQD